MYMYMEYPVEWSKSYKSMYFKLNLYLTNTIL